MPALCCKQNNNMIKFNRNQPIKEIKFKPVAIPDGFMLVVDTREQTGLFQKPPKGLVMVRDTLKHGDYSIKGFEDKVCIERKQMSDFLTYIGKDRDKTAEKLSYMQDMYFKALVIELDRIEKNDSEQKALYRIPSWSKLKVEHIRGFQKSVRVKYGVHIYYSFSRKACERFILDHLTYAYEQLRSTT